MAFARRSKFHNVASTINKSHGYHDVRSSTAENTQGVAVSSSHLVVAWTTRNGASIGVRRIDDFEKGDPWALLHPQAQTITDIRFHPYRDDILATAGEDQKAIVSRFPEKVVDGEPLDRLASLDHDKSVSAVRFHPSAENVMGTASHDNTVKIWDITGGNHKNVSTISLPGAVDDLTWSYNGASAAAVDKTKNLHILDPRQGGSAAKIEAHQGTKPMKCFWIGNTDRVGTTGFSRMRERELKVWDSRQMNKSLGSHSFSSAPGVLVPHFDPDSMLLYLGGRGEGMIHTFDMSSTKAPHLTSLMTGKVQDRDSHLSIAMLPKRALDVMDLEVGRIFRVLKDSVQIVHMNLSRPNKAIFYPELFPDSPSSTSLSAEEYFGGVTKDPVLSSLEPKGV